MDIDGELVWVISKSTRITIDAYTKTIVDILSTKILVDFTCEKISDIIVMKICRFPSNLNIKKNSITITITITVADESISLFGSTELGNKPLKFHQHLANNYPGSQSQKLESNN